MERDERQTFADLVKTFCLLAREAVLLSPQPSGMPRWKIIIFREPLEDARTHITDAADVGWQRTISDLNAAGVEPRGLVENEVLPPAGGAMWGLAYGKVEEWWFNSELAAIRAAPLLRKRQPRQVLVLTNEVVLYDT